MFTCGLSQNFKIFRAIFPPSLSGEKCDGKVLDPSADICTGFNVVGLFLGILNLPNVTEMTLFFRLHPFPNTQPNVTTYQQTLKIFRCSQGKVLSNIAPFLLKPPERNKNFSRG